MRHCTLLFSGTLLLAPALAAQGAHGSGAPANAADEPPPVAREFRAAWVASVANIDWPSRPGLSSWEQQVELLRILNRAVELRLNAIVLQVRPAADALYESRYEPWSEYLTGRMGRAPEPEYDPLAFAVEEAHKRGLELHAWFNPYRARHMTATSEASRNHVGQTQPELVRTYGRYLWLDPGEPAVREHSIRVVLDVVRRYDIDGVHIDDYFYPYKERDSTTGQVIDFPDERSWQNHVLSGGKLTRSEWRRRNVDLFVEQLYRSIKKAKPWVKFGISPFGIWRPGHPEQIAGFDAYEEIYADSRKWLVSGWVDYFTPQLYWSISAPRQSYPVLLEWWVSQNAHGRHIWPGNYTSRVSSMADTTPPGRWPAGELVDQIHATRAQPGASGNIHFSMKALMESRGGIAELLRSGPYAEPALVPPSPWLSRRAPAKPRASVLTDSPTGDVVLELRPPSKGGVPAWLWVVRARTAGRWTTAILPASQLRHTLAPAASEPPDLVLVSAVSRTGGEGERLGFRIQDSGFRESLQGRDLDARAVP
jgi:uncharacterized lipoprotein YddW (UPF0748 family)